MSITSAEFCLEYARHRAAEGRAFRGAELKSLPFLRHGPHARHWAVRAATFNAFVTHVAKPMAATGPISVLDAGAGNGWLCRRMAEIGNSAVALDIRDDSVDGLGAAAEFLVDAPELFTCVRASFTDLPFDEHCFDLIVFNASLHYATDLGAVLAEAIRVTRRGGVLAILDSPFYANDEDGKAMVAEKLHTGSERFGARAELLLSQNFIEFLTPDRLAAASCQLSWSPYRVRYPLWYEMRPLVARLERKRRPSRFDLWTARVP